MAARPPRKLRKPHDRGEVRALVDETIALYHRLAWMAEQIYGDEGHGAARRGILRGLVRYGPQSVPQLARARSVKRQSLQPVVDAMVAEGVVELRDNPRHARSRLVAVTRKGEAIVAHLDRVDEKVLGAVGAGIPRRDLRAAAATLELLRSRCETAMRWRAALAD